MAHKTLGGAEYGDHKPNIQMTTFNLSDTSLPVATPEVGTPTVDSVMNTKMLPLGAAGLAGNIVERPSAN